MGVKRLRSPDIIRNISVDTYSPVIWRSHIPRLLNLSYLDILLYLNVQITRTYISTRFQRVKLKCPKCPGVSTTLQVDPGRLRSFQRHLVWTIYLQSMIPNKKHQQSSQNGFFGPSKTGWPGKWSLEPLLGESLTDDRSSSRWGSMAAPQAPKSRLWSMTTTWEASSSSRAILRVQNSFRCDTQGYIVLDWLH